MGLKTQNFTELRKKSFSDTIWVKKGLFIIPSKFTQIYKSILTFYEISCPVYYHAKHWGNALFFHKHSPE